MSDLVRPDPRVSVRGLATDGGRMYSGSWHE